MENITFGKKLEQITFRLYYSDGIFDLSFGSMLLIYAINSWLDINQVETPWIMRILIVPVVVCLVLFKTFFTSKRIGHVKFSPSRNRKRLQAMLIAVIALILTSVLFYLASTGRITSDEKDSVLPLIIEFVFLVGIFGMLAFFTDYYNFYIVGLAMGVGSPLSRLFEPILETRLYGLSIMFLAGLCLFVYGIIQLISFLNKYPKPGNHEE